MAKKYSLKISSTLSNNRIINFTCKSGKPITYYSTEAKAYNALTAKEIAKQWKRKPLGGEVGIEIIIYGRFYNKKDGNIKSKDIDNYLKAFFNALTGVVINDDKQIFKMKVEKVHEDCDDRMEIGLYELSAV